MRKIIRHLENKSVPTKRFIALSTSAIITGLLAIIWVNSLGHKAEKVAERRESPNPFSLISQSFKDMMARTKGNQSANVLDSLSPNQTEDGAIILTPQKTE